jgi:hypothetical protein
MSVMHNHCNAYRNCRLRCKLGIKRQIHGVDHLPFPHASHDKVGIDLKSSLVPSERISSCRCPDLLPSPQVDEQCADML